MTSHPIDAQETVRLALCLQQAASFFSAYCWNFPLAKLIPSLAAALFSLNSSPNFCTSPFFSSRSCKQTAHCFPLSLLKAPSLPQPLPLLQGFIYIGEKFVSVLLSLSLSFFFVEPGRKVGWYKILIRCVRRASRGHKHACNNCNNNGCVIVCVRVLACGA